jgi:hypothetical protein
MRGLYKFLFLIPLITSCSVFSVGETQSIPSTEIVFTVTAPLATALSVPSHGNSTSTPFLVSEPNPFIVQTPYLERKISPLTVHYHPDGPLYAGDLVSMEVIAAPDDNLEGFAVQVETEDGGLLGPVDFDYYGIGKRLQATLQWTWDTTNLPPENHTLTYSIVPDGPSWTEIVSLQPAEDVPYPEPGAHWALAETNCCQVNYITGTAAERDLAQLLEIIDSQANSASQQMNVEIDEPISITFLPRVLGHGGFASTDISLSYLDRNYAGSSPGLVMHHEMIHKLDARAGGDFRPSILVEGLAVYLTGGHFKPEPLIPRAAALLPPEDECIPVDSDLTLSNSKKDVPVCTLDWYIPIEDLAGDDFYFSQHEISYLEAASLVEFMVNTWGLDAWDTFYRDIHLHITDTKGSSIDELDSKQAIDKALTKHFDISLKELEGIYLQALAQEKVTAQHVNDIRFTVEYYDTVRRYQQALDPSAYFLTAWLVDGEQMREKGIVADYLRHPSTAENIALETMLGAADKAFLNADYSQTEYILNAVNTVLDSISTGQQYPFSNQPLAEKYYAIANILISNGYQPQKLQIEQDMAQALVLNDIGELITIHLSRSEGGWLIQIEAQ